MKKLLLCLALAGSLVFALGATAGAQAPTFKSLATTVAGTDPATFVPAWAALGDTISPTVSAIDPVSGRDDGDTPVTITGADFADTPTVTLGDTALADVTWVDGATLTATVPSGMSPGVYPLTVVNPDAGSGALPGAFTVTAVIPTVSTIAPALGANDIGTFVTITGADFAANATASLGPTPLTHVTRVDSTTLTAMVPWGIDPGVYALTVADPDGSDTMAGAFSVTQGIGKWNAGDLYGGEIAQLLMKPDDPGTLYASAYGVIGLFRSDNAGDSWTFASDKVWANNNEFVVDPLHPDYVYAFAPNGLMRSPDKGDTWTTLKDDKWPDGRDMHAPQVYVSPYEDATHPQALFVSSSSNYGTSDAGGAFGLITSTGGGAPWTIVTDLEGQKVQDIAFAPDPAHRGDMVLVTSDMKVYKSTDWGAGWTEVATSDLTPTSLGLGGSISFNPGGSEVWIDCVAQGSSGGIFKSAASDLTSWAEVSQQPGSGSSMLAFTGDASVYIPRFHSGDGGATWDPFGPSPWYGYGALAFHPTDPLTAYISNDAVGVQKTIDGGVTWTPKIDGLTALSCNSMDVSKVDPLRVYATFNGPQGIYRSDDGTSHWTFFPVAGSWNVRQILVDPFDPQRVYMGADSDFYESTDGGESWSDLGWKGLPDPHPGLFVTVAADPHHSGHLLASFGGGSYGIGPGYLYGSDDHGASWQAITMPQAVNWIHSIAFDPGATGVVYLTTAGAGVYKSADSGGSWTRIGDEQPDLANAHDICVATGPQPMLIAGVSPNPYRSLDGGATWQMAGRLPGGGTNLMFANNDSTRLYFASPQGLYFSSDAGDTWERAAGAFGRLQTTAVGYANADGHTILYAATNGGDASVVSGASVRTGRMALDSASTMVGAGIYRYAQVAGQTTACALSTKSGAIGYSAKRAVSGTLTLTGSTMGVLGCSVQLRTSSDGKMFTDAGAPYTTTAGGSFTFTVAPDTKTYYRVSFAGSGDYYLASTSGAISLTPRVHLSAPTAPSTARRARAFASIAYLKPRHAVGTVAVKLQCYHKERRSNGTYRWTLRKTVSARASDYSTYSKVKGKVSLPYAGKWRLRVYHAADSKNAATYSSYRYLRVR